MTQTLGYRHLENFATDPQLSLVAFYLFVALVCPAATPTNDIVCYV